MQLAASAAARSTLASAAWNKGWTASNSAFLFNNICVSSPSGDGRLLSVRGVGNVDPISEKGTIDRIGAPDERAGKRDRRKGNSDDQHDHLKDGEIVTIPNETIVARRNDIARHGLSRDPSCGGYIRDVPPGPDHTPLRHPTS